MSLDACTASLAFPPPSSKAPDFLRSLFIRAASYQQKSGGSQSLVRCVHRSHRLHRTPGLGDFYCRLKHALWDRVQFDHALMYKGKLRLIEFDDEDYEGRNHPRRKEKIHAYGLSNVPFRIFYSRDLWSEDVEEQILIFVFTNVVGKQDVIPSPGSWDFVQRHLSWQMTRQYYDRGQRVYGWATKYIQVGNAYGAESQLKFSSLPVWRIETSEVTGTIKQVERSCNDI